MTAFQEPWFWIISVATLLVIYLTGIPLGMLVLGSLKLGGIMGGESLTLDNFRLAFGNSGSLSLLFNSLIYAGGTCALAIILGTSLAFGLERTNIPLKNLFTAFALVPLVIPGILHTIAWILLLSPRIGVINSILVRMFGLHASPFNIFSMGGMIWVEGIHLSPLVFVIMIAAFRSMDPALEEAALSSGAGYFTMFRRITLRMVTPAITATALIMFILGLESFEVPALIGLRGGIKVLTSRIWLALREFPPDFGLAAAFAVGLFAGSGIGILLYHRLISKTKQFATITSHGHRSHVIDLGKWRYLIGGAFLVNFAVLVGFPLLILLWTSLNKIYTFPSLAGLSQLTFENYSFIMRLSRTRTAVMNSTFLSLTSGVIVMLVTSVIAWITVRGRWFGRGMMDVVTFLPISIPGIVLGVSLIWVYAILPIPIYGTLWILLISYVTRYLPYGLRVNSAAMVQINDELEEAAAISGSSRLQSFQHITLPLLKPGLIGGFIYVVIVSFREISSSILLYSSKSIIISILIFDLWDAGQFSAVAALSILMITSLIILVVLASRLGAYFNIRG